LARKWLTAGARFEDPEDPILAPVLQPIEFGVEFLSAHM